MAFNYRERVAVDRTPSTPRKIGTVSEESDESLGWLEFIEAGRLLQSEELQRLLTEARELASIMSASYGTARYKERNKRDQGNNRNG